MNRGKMGAADATHFRPLHTCGKRSSCLIVRGCDVADGNGGGDGADDGDLVIRNDNDGNDGGGCGRELSSSTKL